jgi:hypothetical protein
MNEGIQNTLRGRLKTDGCYFLAILRLVELETGKEFTVSQIEDIMTAAVLAGMCKEDLTIQKAHEIYNLAFGAEVKHTTEKAKTPVYPCIGALEKPGFTHFIVYKGPHDTWDSLDPKRPAAKSYTLKDYRVIV